MKKILFVICLSFLLVPATLLAVSSEDVDYQVYDYIVDAKLDISGNMTVKEIIGIKGTFNGYIRDLVYKNDKLGAFTGSDSDFEGSSIYNAQAISVNSVGTIDWNGKLDFDAFNQDVSSFNICSNKNMCYLKSSLPNGISLKMFNETENDITYFYIEYILSNVVVVHEDVAELYYNFIGYNFDDDIKKYKLRLLLPYETDKEVRVWAHGPLTGEVKLISKKENDKDIYYGGYLFIENLSSNTPIDMRLVFPKDLVLVSHASLKKSNVLALDKILDVEEERATEANRQRKVAKIKLFLTYSFTGIYLLVTLGLLIIVYFKYDKERKAKFQNQYNREFIDEYDVTVIEYLFERKISEKAFSTSILNMIYKKNISFEKLNDKDYLFTKISESNLTDSEKKVMEIIFDEAGDGKTTTLDNIKDYASKVNGTSSPFLNKYNVWKRQVTNEAISENFFENQVGIKTILCIYSVFGLILIFFHMLLEIFGVLTILLIIVTVFYFIYVILFTKKTERGIEHYMKWKAFKNFLLDFGRFDEKDLPEIVLWERYLVYASIFGVADKVGKVMKVKFNEFEFSSDLGNRDIFFDYMLWSSLSRNINTTVNSSISTARVKVSEAARSSYSSKGGFGGGFSSGGGFGGGGGGGRGF